MIPLAHTHRDSVSQLFRVKHDDFSVQVESTRDDRFWVRVERLEDDTRQAVVSDLKRSSMPTELVAWALDEALRSAGYSDPASIRFADIAPNAIEATLVDMEAAQIAKIIVLVGDAQGFRVERVERSTRRGKVDVIFHLETTRRDR